MPIARNKKTTVDPDAIAAFGAAAEALPSEAPKSPQPPARAKAPAQGAGDAPLTALVRWRGHEALRDRIADYNKATRYPNHAIMLRAMEIGMEDIEKNGME
ncbi:hypothetical protein EDF48_11225 [Curtobacterium sp. PhB191]|uniref:hypothetical protein n=1 Tax=Curtobacterium sp. PhB191 TaxID=2485202 RepID=UPI001043E85F|nr:hypothetical protein [Curtobacterium sp. PhB191]TCU82273.1 hypothetical protein EDF48_11225 [Curtobacterium sp. PhB191]